MNERQLRRAIHGSIGYQLARGLAFVAVIAGIVILFKMGR